MAFQPAGIYVKEYDWSQYAPALGLTNIVVMGGATKGPIGVPTECTSQQDLVNKFGPPVLNDYGIQSCIPPLAEGINLQYVRVAHSDAAAAETTIPGFTGSAAATYATGTVGLAANPTTGDTLSIPRQIPTVLLTRNAPGTAGNVAITTTSAALLVAGMSGGTSLVAASGSIRFIAGANPTAADTLVISDGVTPVTFTFVASGPTGNQVLIGTNAYATFLNLLAAIAASSLIITATNGSPETIFEFTNTTPGGGHIAVPIGSTAYVTLASLVLAINAATLLGYVATNISTNAPLASLRAAVVGTDGNTHLYGSAVTQIITGMSGGAAATTGTGASIVMLSAFTPGTWGNAISVLIQPTVILGAPAGNIDILVSYPQGSLGTNALAPVEQFHNLSLTAGNARFIDTVLVQGIPNEVGPSAYLSSLTLVAGVVTPGTYVLGTTTTGADGIANLTAADYIGTVSGQSATGLQALQDPNVVEFNVLAIPGITNQAVINAALTLAQTRGDFIYLVDPPFGLSVQQVVDWHNGLAGYIANAPTAPLNSSYGALYWSWVQYYDAYNQTYIWLPPSASAAAVFAFNDSQVGPWAAPAGIERGHVNGLKVEYSPNPGDQGNLVNIVNRVNYILNLVATGDGLTVYANRTLSRVSSALNEVAIRRMLLYAEKLCATAVRILDFRPNSPTTWKRLQDLVNPGLSSLKSAGGLDQFYVICDATTNPVLQQQNKTMKAKLFIVPFDTAEVIELDVTLLPTGASLTLPTA